VALSPDVVFLERRKRQGTIARSFPSSMRWGSRNPDSGVHRAHEVDPDSQSQM
jgi:hypothetical protein